MPTDDETAKITSGSRDSRKVGFLQLVDLEFHPRYANVRGGNVGAALGDLKELKESLATIGLRQALDVVLQYDDAGEPHNYLASGFRRLAALRELEAEGTPVGQVPCILEAGTDADFIYRNLAENIHRYDVNLAAVARRLYQVVEETETPPTVVARNLAKSDRWVRMLVATVRECEHEVINAAADGKIGMRVAHEHFRGHPRDTQIRLLNVAIGVAAATGKTEKALIRATGKAVRLELAEIEKEKLDKLSAPPAAASDPAPLQTELSGAGGTPRMLTDDTAEPPPPLAFPAQAAAPPLPAPMPPVGPTGGQIRERLVVAENAMARMYSDEASKAAQVQSLALDLDRYPDKKTAGVVAWIDGFGAAVLFLQGATCAACGKRVVTIDPGSCTLPAMHWCE